MPHVANDYRERHSKIASADIGVARCRFCQAPLRQTFVDLGKSPLCERFLSADELNHGEVFYPLHVYVCGACFLVQLQEYVEPEEIFSEYAYFSSYSDTWLAHAKAYVEAFHGREIRLA